jgi:hypothetical protein
MKVLHDNHGGPVPADILHDRRGNRGLAARARGVVHRVVKRAPFAGLREVEDVVEKHQLIGADCAGRGKPIGGRAPLVGAGRGRQAQQTADNRANGVLAFAHAEIQHEAAVAGKAQRFDETAHLVDEPGFADARLTANIDDVADSLFEARAGDALELFEFSLAADKHAAVRHDGFKGETAQTPHAHRRVDPLEVHRADGVAHHAVAQRAMHAIGKQRFPGTCGGNQPGSEVHGVAEHRVVLNVRALERPRDHLAAGDSHMRSQRGRALAQSVKCLMNVQRGTHRAQRIGIVCARCTEDAITASPMCLSIVPP